ncbi:LPXTG-motif cell wall-anchored protein [Paenarthrobacter nicotinovorans]|uniref:copper resistance CopC family protein n=1 Tax=Paenarthrobacter nicotinovorans TaxID=29320 RepID=UPI00277DF54F|nr:copper resistance CopC family protein [Paenarthrobacter nicotinovorans]MDP9934549.1 LPXTG-motif cell wall-anchored protein [Paenarthrobacter nicotinovorans]
MSFSLRRARMTGAALAALALTVFLGAVPAQAHDALASSNPADGQTITTNPGKISITLTKAPDTKLPGSNIIKVTAPDGHVVSTGDITVDGATLSIDADIDHPGKHTVDWRAVSADGHPIEGTFSFTYAGAEDEATPATSTTPAATPSGSAPATGQSETTQTAQTGSDNTGLLIGAGAVIVVLAGVVIYLLARRNKANPTD